jgi:hypothetical protein
MMKEKETFCPADGSSARPLSRKTYEKPVLQVYGNLTEITQSMRLFGMNDGAAHPNRHFSF